MEHMLWIGESMIIRNRIKTRNSVIRELAKIKISDIKRVARNILNDNKLNLAIIGPLKPDQKKEISNMMRTN